MDNPFSSIRLHSFLNHDVCLIHLSFHVLTHRNKLVIKTDLVTPSDYDLPYDDINIQTSDKVTLRCYLIECEDPQATVMMFHGNAMDHSSLLYQAKQFHDLDCNVLTVSYRGFGDSEGVPSEKGEYFASLVFFIKFL